MEGGGGKRNEANGTTRVGRDQGPFLCHVNKKKKKKNEEKMSLKAIHVWKIYNNF